MRSWLHDGALFPTSVAERFDDPHPPDDSILDPQVLRAAHCAYTELAVAEYLQFLNHSADIGDVETLAAVDNYRRSLHSLCLAGHIPRPPVDLGAMSLHLEHRNPAVLRLYHQLTLFGVVGDADDSSGVSEGEEEMESQ